MKKNNLLIILFLLPLFLCGQSKYFLIDEKSRSVPNEITNYAEIAKHLAKNLLTDRDKARAIYIWIAHNVKYDLELFEEITNGTYVVDINETIQNKVQKTVDTKKGVCQNYSELFLEMSKEVGLESYVVAGYTKNVLGSISSNSHAWNSVKIGTSYYLLDLTWAAGHVRNNQFIHKFNDDYFFSLPAEFIKSHMPFDPIWQLSKNPITNDQFVKSDLESFQKKGNFIYKDSIELMKKIDPLTALERENHRIMSAGLKNYKVKNLIEVGLKDNTISIYNLAVESTNSGLEKFNEYLGYRNKRFRRPKIKDDKIRTLIDEANTQIEYANEIFIKLSKMKNKPDNLLSQADKMMHDLLRDVNKEKRFVDKYLKAWKPLRIFMM